MWHNLCKAVLVLGPMLCSSFVWDLSCVARLYWDQGYVARFASYKPELDRQPDCALSCWPCLKTMTALISAVSCLRTMTVLVRAVPCLKVERGLFLVSAVLCLKTTAVLVRAAPSLK